MNELIDRIIVEQFKEIYETKIKVQLTTEGEREYELTDDEVVINFDIEIEYRSWGIKDIDIKPKGNIEIDVMRDDEVETIKVDVENVVVEFERGYSYIKPLWIDIRLSAEGDVIESKLHVSSK